MKVYLERESVRDQRKLHKGSADAHSVVKKVRQEVEVLNVWQAFFYLMKKKARLSLNSKAG